MINSSRSHLEDKENCSPSLVEVRSRTSQQPALKKLRPDDDDVIDATNELLRSEYNVLKRKFVDCETENKRLRNELSVSNAKIDIIVNNRYFNQLLNVSTKAVPAIDIFEGLLESASTKAVESPGALQISVVNEDRNPLLNDLILTQMFSYVRGKDLKICRQVSSKWYFHATRHFKKSHQPIFLENSRTITRFAQTMSNSIEFPYSTVLLKNRFLPRFSTQFLRFAHHLRGLKIVVNTRVNHERPDRTHPHLINLSNVINILNMTRNLETLELYGLLFGLGYVQPEGYGQLEIPSLKNIILNVNYNGGAFNASDMRQIENNPNTDLVVRRLFDAAPELTSLRVGIFGRSILPKFLTTICRAKKLQILEFENCLSESHLAVLVQGSFNLKSLKCVIHLEDCQLFQKLLVAQANTLEVLDINLSTFSRTPLPLLTFPSFPNLRRLKFVSSFYSPQALPFQRRLIRNQFPILKTLWVSEDVLQTFFDNKHASHEVDTMAFDMGLETIGRGFVSFPNLKTYFPKLKRIFLKTQRANDIEAMFRTCGDFLEELYLEYSPQHTGKSITSVLTGIAQPDWMTDSLKRLNDDAKLIRQLVVNFLQEAADVGLHNLTSLKRLEILCDNQSGLGCIKDSAVYLTFLSMQPLDYLAVYNSNLSETSVAVLRKRHKTVIFKNLNKAERKPFLVN